MLIKWIVCIVTEEQREAFSTAQEQWRALSGVDGFHGQFGGWNEANPEEACIVGYWRDEEVYRTFMEVHHDRIFEGSSQGRTYERIAVKLLTEGDEQAQGFPRPEELYEATEAEFDGKPVRLVPSWTVEGKRQDGK